MGQPTLDSETAKLVDMASSRLKQAVDTVKRNVQGQDELVELVMACLASGDRAHVLIEGPPGTGKTTLVRSIANVMSLTTDRIQFTPDLMPSDITGSDMVEYDENDKRRLKFEPGAVFTQLLHADEINRASPKTQSGLLEGLQEGYVTVSRKNRRALPKPFHVIATQNPQDTEGANVLPEAQMDRFTIRLLAGNVAEDIELAAGRADINKPGETAKLFARITAARNKTSSEDLSQRGEKDEFALPAVLEENDLLLFQKLSRDLPISDELNQAIIRMVRKFRPQEDSADTGIKEAFNKGTDGFRTAQALRAMVRGLALVRGDYAPDESHLRAVAVPVIGHRLGFTSWNHSEQEKARYIETVMDKTLG